MMVMTEDMTLLFQRAQRLLLLRQQPAFSRQLICLAMTCKPAAINLALFIAVKHSVALSLIALSIRASCAYHMHRYALAYSRSFCACALSWQQQHQATSVMANLITHKA